MSATQHQIKTANKIATSYVTNNNVIDGNYRHIALACLFLARLKDGYALSPSEEATAFDIPVAEFEKQEEIILLNIQQYDADVASTFGEPIGAATIMNIIRSLFIIIRFDEPVYELALRFAKYLEPKGGENLSILAAAYVDLAMTLLGLQRITAELARLLGLEEVAIGERIHEIDKAYSISVEQQAESGSYRGHIHPL